MLFADRPLTDRPLSEEQRLVLALALALVLHAVVILGVRFSVLPEPSQEPIYSLNVSLVEHRGGRLAEFTSGAITPQEVVDTQLSPVRQPPLEEGLVATVASSSVDTTRLQSTETSAPAPAIPHVVDMMSNALKMAGLEPVSLIQDSREKYIDPKSMTNIEGFYMESWRRRVEQLATSNFPEAAQRLKLIQGPILDVAILADGSIHSITLVRSSGNLELDDAAQHIVRLGEPYAPFPAELQRQYDILHIVRKWRFEQGRLLGR